MGGPAGGPWGELVTVRVAGATATVTGGFPCRPLRDNEGVPTTLNPKLVSWASDIEEETVRQAEKTARLPIVEGHVALMPDAHVGIGATVGSVIPTKGAVIPSAVGVDIGCGMIAAELDLTEDRLPDDLEPLLGRIERAVPAGVGQGYDRPGSRADRWLADHRPATDLSREQARKAATQFGTLGSGNHFFELCLDERGHVWVVLHSGSGGSATSWLRCTSPRPAAWASPPSSASKTPIWPGSCRARPSSRPT